MKLNKTIFYLFLGTSLALGTTSCSDYLDTEPITARAVPLTDTPYTTASQAEDLMNSIYAGLGSEYWQLDYFFNGAAQSDVAYMGGDNPQNQQQAEYRILATNSNVSRDWNYLFGLINDCNKVLNYVDNIADPALTTARKEQMKAEAATMRAMYYFHAVQLWGDVPLVTKAVIGVTAANFEEVYNQVYPARKPVSEVYALILSDLEGAAQVLPSSADKYKVSKGVALALLAQVNATKPNPDYAKVITYADGVIGGGYSLIPNYGDLFDDAHNANSESIFEINGNGGSIWWWGTFMFIGNDWKKFNNPSNDLVKAFDTEGDVVRKTATVKFEAVGWTDNYWPSTNYPFAYKQRETSGNQNVYILRLADILLLKAEAKVKTGAFAEAATLINQVRTRAGLGAVAPITSEADGINKVLHERKLELAFEGQRWFDLKRTGKALEILKNRKDQNGVVLPYCVNLTQERLLWPIPQNQIDNNPNLTQNIGY